MTFFKENEEQFRLFLDEQPATFTEGENEQPVNGYSYTGDEEDGSTLIDAKGVTADNMRGKFISGLIRKRYSGCISGKRGHISQRICLVYNINKVTLGNSPVFCCKIVYTSCCIILYYFFIS